ncbi:hypothetical protein FIU97_14570 [Roseivivax sp. THAF40]|uniref:hypothetical protein n=1 Tax=Roseivivax sp. THAF40 TaxID=2587858 RepID=UPI0012AAB1B5|nr:hypothetical protein [Roseivivax sp. THAF40]QFT47803.1 hypothetical protein FIU97_14570 [Roseivivax sp. THAF40]
MATKNLSDRIRETLAAAEADIAKMPETHDGVDLKGDKRTALIQLEQALNNVRKLEKLTA